MRSLPVTKLIASPSGARLAADGNLVATIETFGSRDARGLASFRGRRRSRLGRGLRRPASPAPGGRRGSAASPSASCSARRPRRHRELDHGAGILVDDDHRLVDRRGLAGLGLGLRRRSGRLGRQLVLDIERHHPGRFGRRRDDVALEHADDALAIAIDANGPLAPCRTQQVDEIRKAVGAFVERGVDLANDLLHVAQVHRPPPDLSGADDVPEFTQSVGIGADDGRRAAVARALSRRGVPVAAGRRRLGGRNRFLVSVGLVGRDIDRGRLVLGILGRHDQPAALALLELHEADLLELLDEVAERPGAVAPFREGRIELQERALEQAQSAATPRVRTAPSARGVTSGNACSIGARSTRRRARRAPPIAAAAAAAAPPRGSRRR